MSAPGSRDVHIRYHRPPDRLDLFVQELIHDDGRVKITFARDLHLDEPLRIGERNALEPGSDVVWFTFPGAWHDIGRFHRADGILTGIYANILVPCVFDPGRVWDTTDLFLDLWIPVGDDGWRGGASAPRLLDADELREAEEQGWVTPQVARRARDEARRLLTGASAGTWPPPVVAAWDRERALRSRDADRTLE